MSNQNAPETVTTKAEILDHMRRAYARLDQVLQPLTDEQLSRPGPSGWAIKDHLVHLAAWEMGIAELLLRRSRFAGMGLQDAEIEGRSEDGVNDLIYRRNASLTPAEAMEKFRAAHRQMLSVIDSLNDDDLRKPYIDYLPTGSDGPHAPVYHWIAGNSYAHVDEHIRWIQDILASQPKGI